MIYLISAILSSTLIFVTFKVFKKFNIDIMQAITINYVIASAFGFLFLTKPVDISTIPQQPWFYPVVFVGIMFIVVFNIFAQSSQKAGVAITAVASKMSVIIPVFIGFSFFHENINWLKISGIIIAIIAFYLILKKDKTIKVNKRYLLLPLLLFLGNGTNDTLLKYIQHFFINTQEDYIIILTLIFLIALCLGAVFLIIRSFTNKKRIFTVPAILGGVILGLLNWGSTYFFLKGLSAIDVSVFIPVLNVGIVTLSSLVGFFIFKETLKIRNIIGIIIAVLAIFLITYGRNM